MSYFDIILMGILWNLPLSKVHYTMDWLSKDVQKKRYGAIPQASTFQTQEKISRNMFIIFITTELSYDKRQVPIHWIIAI